MNPYEATADEMRRQSEGPKRFAKGAVAAGSLALGASSFAPILSRAAPFLSQYIPENLAIKGLSKVSPALGSFIKDAMDGGYDFKEVKDFIGKQVSESQQATAKENRNIIEQYSPELHQFIMQHIQAGKSPLEAGALATLNKKGQKDFNSIISKITQEHKAPWSAILESVYGGQATQGQQAQPTQQPQQAQQGGPGQQALMDILNKINQRLGQ